MDIYVKEEQRLETHAQKINNSEVHKWNLETKVSDGVKNKACTF